MKKYLQFIVKTLVIVGLFLSFIGITGCRSETTDEKDITPGSYPDTENNINTLRSVAYPGVIEDGDGGALVIYAELTPGDEQVIHVSRIGRSGESMWDQVLGKGYSFMGDHLKLSSDGSGGVITYVAVSPVDDVEPPVETIFRINSNGDIVWRTSLPVNRSIKEMASDGSGGAIFSYRDSRQHNNCYIQRVDSQGHLLWGEDELLLRRDNYQFGSLRLISDGSGGAIITWHERGNESGSRVCAQRIDAGGNFLWEGQSLIKKGKVLYTTDRISEGQQGEMIGNDSGGVLLTWIESTGTPPELYDVTAMQIDSDGVLEWESHIELDTDVTISNYVAFPFIIRDDTETMLFWSDANTIYAQKLSASGEPLWPNNGIVVWRDQICLRLASQGTIDGSGGVFIAWSYIEKTTSPQGTKIGVQKLSFEGTTQWDTEGLLVETIENTFSTLADLVPDGEGGILITWTLGTEIGASEDSYIQKINGESVSVWEPGGIKLGR